MTVDEYRMKRVRDFLGPYIPKAGMPVSRVMDVPITALSREELMGLVEWQGQEALKAAEKHTRQCNFLDALRRLT